MEGGGLPASFPFFVLFRCIGLASRVFAVFLFLHIDLRFYFLS